MSRYQTPEALRKDAGTLAEDVHALIAATSEIADEKVAEARQRLASALGRSKEACNGLKERVNEYAKVADEAVREHPYQVMFVAFGLGALVGCLLTRRG